MIPYAEDLDKLARANQDFRRVLFTGTHSQLVIMTLAPGEEIGEEVHDVDQILYAVDGEGESIIAGQQAPFEKGDVVAIPAGALHNIRNTDDKPLQLFTVYAPPNHAAGTVHHTRAEAEAAEQPVGVPA